jgi:hypothetical protein
VVRTVVGSLVSKKTKGRDEYANEGAGGCCCCRGGRAKDRGLGWCARARGFATEARFWQLKARVKRSRVRPLNACQVKKCQCRQGITRNGCTSREQTHYLLPTPYSGFVSFDSTTYVHYTAERQCSQFSDPNSKTNYAV